MSSMALEKISQEKKHWVVVIFSFHFLMLHHWIASQEGLSIKWSQDFGSLSKCFKKLVKRLLSKLKSESKCGECGSIFLLLASFWRNFAQKETLLGS
jgi:hypothetical protein